MFVDAHCHLDFAQFDEDRQEMFARAEAATVAHFIVPGTTRASWSSVLALGRRQEISVGLGLHPYFIAEHRAEDIDALEAQLDEHVASEQADIVALGECGIDARFSETLDDQWRFFDAQLRLAKAYELPVVIHCVHADDKVSKRLKQLDLPAGGLVHAFTGSPEQAAKFYELGYKVGLGGAVTYERAQRVQRMVASLSDDAYVLETDSPDMPLCGYQGQRNEPARVVQVAEAVARLRRQSIEQVAADSTANAKRLFGLEGLPHLTG